MSASTFFNFPKLEKEGSIYKWAVFVPAPIGLDSDRKDGKIPLAVLENSSFHIEHGIFPIEFFSDPLPTPLQWDQ